LRGVTKLSGRSAHILFAAVGRIRRRRFRSRRFKKMVRSNRVLVTEPSATYLQDIRLYWEQHYGRRINPRWHIACANVTGVEDVKYIPHDVWWDDVIPFFNDLSMFAAYSDKNLYSILLRDCDAPKAVLKRINGRYYDTDHRLISRDLAIDKICSDGRDKIIKPSRTDNGKGIRKITISHRQALINSEEITLPDIEHQYGRNFIVQDMIVQHPSMAEPHPPSVNTLRLLTFRWNDTVRVLMSFARFGTNARVNDNAGTGGVCCGIDENGRLNDIAVDEYGRRYVAHPSTGYSFGKLSCIPNFDAIRRHVVTLHEQVPHFDLVSWDIAVGPQAQPIFVEMNFRGASYIYQYACKRSIFGDLTSEVLQALRRCRRNSRGR
jgi:Sugar-transfer associated ATP-grasp